VPTEEALSYSKTENISFLETSAMSGDNCTVAMQLILQDIHKSNGTRSPLQPGTKNSEKLPTASVKLAYEEPKQEDQGSENGNKSTRKKCR